MTDVTNPLFVATAVTDNLTLVGPGKKFTDVKALELGKIEADNHIKNIEKEMSELRAELKTRMSLEDFWAKTEEARKTVEPRPAVSAASLVPSNAGNAASNEAGNPTLANGRTSLEGKNETQDIQAMVREALALELSKGRQNANVELVRTGLQKVFGDNYVEKLKARTSELGLGEDFVGSIAARSPQAVFALLGVDPKQNPTSLAPNANLPPASTFKAGSNGTGGTSLTDENADEYYENMRRTDPARYFTKEVQVERHKRALDPKNRHKYL